MTRELRLIEFLERLAAATPTPGGGSAAGLTGSLAAALVAMVAALTLGKKSYQDVAPQMREILQEAQMLRDQLTDLIDHDAAAFAQVMAAAKLPKETEEQKRLRQEQLQQALQQATEIPYQTAQKCYRVLELAEIVVMQGNKNAASDGGAAALLAEGALQAALLNVDINLAQIADETFRSAYTHKRQALTPKARMKREAVWRAVAARL